MSVGPGLEIAVVGSCMTDLIATVPRLPRLGETVIGTSFTTGFGGKGANQAVQAARLGGRVAMVARVGDDDFGRATLANFAHHGVDARHVEVVAGVPSGVAPIAVQSDGHNTVVIVPGANDTLTREAVGAALDDLGPARAVLCQLEVPDAAVAAAFEWAAAHGVRTILNPAPARPVADEILVAADVLAPNETELMLLTGAARVDDLTEVARAARALRRRPAQVVVVTLGARGAWLLDADGERAIATPGVDAVDSTGAGDAFVGTLTLWLARGASLAEATEAACRLAADSVRRPGTQVSFADAAALPGLGVAVPVDAAPTRVGDASGEAGGARSERGA